LLSVNDTVKFMFVVQIEMYHCDMYVKVASDNFNNKRRYDDEKCCSRHIRFVVYWVSRMNTLTVSRKQQ